MSAEIPNKPASSAPAPNAPKSMDAIMALCKRRGFIFQASDIYGGINGFWDYGPLGAQLKKNLRDAWWQDMILQPCWGRKGPNGQRVECVPVETRIIQHPKVWEASGHVGGFNDPMVDDKETKGRFRADHIWGIYSLDHPEIDVKRGVYQTDAGSFPYSSSESLPSLSMTIVASSSGEAASMLETDKKLQKLLGVKSVTRVAKFDSLKEELPCFVIDRGIPNERFAIASAFLAVKSNPSRVPSPYTNKAGQLTEPRQFNLMFSTHVGATASADDKAYLRPETAQGVFLQFKNVVDSSRVKVPFGIGNTGTSFRNEVTPRNFTFRSREFDQAELEFFCHPDESFEWYKFWRDFRMDWWKQIGLAGENLILREHAKDELSHYSVGTSDVEYRFPFTFPEFGELEGIAHRGNYDLTQHQKHSGAKLEYFDQDRGETLPNGSKRGERYLPHCIEPAAGLDRGVLAILCEAYTRDESRPSPEIMKFNPRVAPIKAAVFPLVNKDGMPEIAEKLYEELFKTFGRSGFIETDAKQSIGRRYARMDEAGCPYCFTIDGQTSQDQTVTVRDRDTGNQQRIAMDQVKSFLVEKLGV